ncbi:MAG TPA: type II toxin-antitoxin system RelE/ParE family toxin [Candidatus Limnocylindrales bacterium]|nr:type II toxin-antitoxin system RelE/ParE family toxin [Candidatus Limnocylindrales bacterium]
MSYEPKLPSGLDNLLLAGEKLAIVFAVRTNGSMPAKDFFDGELTDAERRKFRPPMERLAETRRVENREHFKKVEATNLWEFKSHQIRLLGGYLDDGRFALAHGIKKKQDRLKSSDIQVAEEILREFVHGEKERKRNQNKSRQEKTT